MSNLWNAAGRSEVRAGLAEKLANLALMSGLLFILQFQKNFTTGTGIVLGKQTAYRICFRLFQYFLYFLDGSGADTK
jgi:hypothetical protein